MTLFFVVVANSNSSSMEFNIGIKGNKNASQKRKINLKILKKKSLFASFFFVRNPTKK